MSGYDSVRWKTLLLRAGAVILVIGLALLFGSVLARLTTRSHLSELPSGGSIPPPGNDEVSPEANFIDPKAPPVYFLAGASTQESDRTLAMEEVSMAGESGLHQFILPVSLPWGTSSASPVFTVIEQLVIADPLAAFVLQVDLNPPAEWLQAHPTEQVVLQGAPQPFASPASEPWMADVRNGLATLIEAIGKSPYRKRLMGIIPAGLHGGQWHYATPGFDTSTAAAKGFSVWLRGIYVEEEALQVAWGNTAVTFDSAVLPERPDTTATTKCFFSLPEQQPVVDGLNYFSERTADTLAAITAHIKQEGGADIKVIVPYGYTFELLNNDAGHFSLSILLGSDVDGFISPVSYLDRGSGGAGGFMGPVDSARYHEKQWLIVDDTRTGVSRDAVTGAVTHLKGIRTQDVYSVQQRNFAAALIHQLGVAWSDPAGEGWLHDQDQWIELARMRELYATEVNRAAAPPAESADESATGAAPNPAANPEQDPAATAPPAAAPASSEEEQGVAEEAKDGAPGEDTPEAPAPEVDTAAPVLQEVAAPPVSITYDTRLMVVVDEVSRFYQQCDQPLNELLLAGNRDAAMRSGVSTEFCLLQDVLDGDSPPAAVYLFTNVFYLPSDQRAILHDRLAREQACAIWMYAPGYLEPAASVDNITATTLIHVTAFEKPEDATSQYVLGGDYWLEEGETLAVPGAWAPLFYIDDPEADSLTQYKASAKVSTAVRYTDAGWTSIYVAMPTLTPGLLREILRILEQPIIFRAMNINQFDAVHVGTDLIAIHGRQIGERTIELDTVYDVQDLLNPAIGWPKNDSFVMPLETGETRLLRLSPPKD